MWAALLSRCWIFTVTPTGCYLFPDWRQSTPSAFRSFRLENWPDDDDDDGRKTDRSRPIFLWATEEEEANTNSYVAHASVQFDPEMIQSIAVFGKSTVQWSLLLLPKMDYVTSIKCTLPLFQLKENTTWEGANKIDQPFKKKSSISFPFNFYFQQHCTT